MEFKAIKKGTLSNPYRRIRKGETVHLAKMPEKCSWLVLKEKFVEEKEIPVVAHMNVATPKPPQTHKVAPAPAGPQYNQGMAEIKAKEAVQDSAGTPDMVEFEPNRFIGEAIIAKPGEGPVGRVGNTAPKEPVTEHTGTEENQNGTGNQGVID